MSQDVGQFSMFANPLVNNLDCSGYKLNEKVKSQEILKNQ